MADLPILHLDCCSLNRPLDDLSQPRIAMEAGAVEELIELVQKGSVRLARSAILIAEVNACTADERRRALNTTLALATVELELVISPEDENFSKLVAAGLKDVDALHVLAAQRGATFFVTTDDAILKRAKVIRRKFGVRVLTPVEAAAEVRQWLS